MFIDNDSVNAALTTIRTALDNALPVGVFSMPSDGSDGYATLTTGELRRVEGVLRFLVDEVAELRAEHSALEHVANALDRENGALHEQIARLESEAYAA